MKFIGMARMGNAVLCLSVGLALQVPARAATEATTYYHNDSFGTPALATDANGSVLWKENYRPYGDKLNQQDASVSNRIGFHGKPFENATGLSYMQARYYDPTVGRFMGIDPVGVQDDNVHTINRYTFAHNNPYGYADPDGQFPVPLVLFVVGAVVDAGVQYAVNGKVNVVDAIIAGGAAAVTGGAAAVFARGVTLGTATATQAVVNTALVGSAAGATASVAQDAQKGNVVSVPNAIINGVAGAVGAGVGARSATSTAGKVNSLIGSKDNLLHHIGKTTRSSNVGPGARAGAGEIATGAGVDAVTNTSAKKLEQPTSRRP